MAKSFGGIGNMGNLLKQAQEVQSKVAQIQQEMAQKTVEASSGGGMVQVSVSGQFALSSIKIDPAVVNPQDIEMLQDLIQAAVNEGVRRAKEMVSEEMSKLTGGIKIPGLMT
ncbi:MAG TPA: YbaB/EbfC family nucleoid-associated protein [Candidatus Binatia bacterium]